MSTAMPSARPNHRNPTVETSSPVAPRAVPVGSALLLADADDAAMWQRLEDLDDGRLALEADHLFDTSYPWAW